MDSIKVEAKRAYRPKTGNIIAPEQTGFVEGRQILDGILVTQEVIHSLKTKKHRGMMMKLDLSKAYDRLNWNYLRVIRGAYGFDNRWIEWVYSMISTPNFSILVNGTPTSTFNATRGIRQGDPISPFLFIMAVEGLGRYLIKELREKRIKGIKLWGNYLPITHQQFVNDVMLFGEVSVKEVRNFKRVLEIFMEASGMEINNEKSCTFIFNTPDSIKAHLTRTLGFRQGELPTKYLGIQLDIENINQDIEKLYTKEVELRKIKIRPGRDILRWGKSMKGTYTVKEVYYLATKQEREEGVVDWRVIWADKWWPKVTIFAWLVSKERTLTWDKIQQRGFYGPSICSLCRKDVETKEHILNKCPFARCLREEIRVLFGKTKRDANNIVNTMMQWGKGKFLSRVVRRVWNLSVGFVIWSIWKE